MRTALPLFEIENDGSSGYSPVNRRFPAVALQTNIVEKASGNRVGDETFPPSSDQVHRFYVCCPRTG